MGLLVTAWCASTAASSRFFLSACSLAHLLASPRDRVQAMRQLPTSLSEFQNFVLYFNGESQALVHDYPWSLPIVSVLLYWLMVWVGPKMMANRKPFSLRRLLTLWNLFLAILSVVMFVGMIVPMVDFLNTNGFLYLMCMPREDPHVGSAFFFLWLFALSKYIELLDTVFIILRKRPLNLLHWYHHTTVLVYTWFSVATLTSPGSIFAVVNAFVHCIMYFYYFLASTGRRPSWGKAVTIIQLTQMVVGIAISVTFTILYFTEEDCPMGHPHAYMLSSLALYGSYFALFLKFYIQRYMSKKPRTVDNKTQASKATNKRPKKE